MAVYNAVRRSDDAQRMSRHNGGPGRVVGQFGRTVWRRSASQTCHEEHGARRPLLRALAHLSTLALHLALTLLLPLRASRRVTSRVSHNDTGEKTHNKKKTKKIARAQRDDDASGQRRRPNASGSVGAHASPTSVVLAVALARRWPARTSLEPARACTAPQTRTQTTRRKRAQRDARERARGRPAHLGALRAAIARRDEHRRATAAAAARRSRRRRARSTSERAHKQKKTTKIGSANMQHKELANTSAARRSASTMFSL